MPLVDIYLSGRKYSVSCEAGQEKRLRELGDYVGGRLRELAESGVTGSDAHMLALVSLVLSDELFDATEELEKAKARPGATASAAKETDRDAAVALIDSATRRIEDLAARLEQA